MDARTRERLPVLPALVRAVARRRDARPCWPPPAAPARRRHHRGGADPGPRPHQAAAAGIWADEPAAGKRRDLTTGEDHAFWTWAAIEVLRATGIRIEELLSSATTAWSSTGCHLPASWSRCCRSRRPRPTPSGSSSSAPNSPTSSPRSSAGSASPAAPSRWSAPTTGTSAWTAPAPLLFQRRHGSTRRAITDWNARKILAGALARTGLTDPASGPLRYTPHDFRRMFITDAILNGLPPHIAQVIAGHRDINVTLGYKAVYPEQAIQAHLAFLARRRAQRPTDEYRVPTDAEWAEFLGHFERRKVATGTCARAFGTPCIHEHSCLRCSMHWPDPAQRPRIAEIRDNLTARIAEAEREGWLGEVDGLRISLAGADDKLAQIDRRNRPAATDLGMPALSRDPS